MSERQNTLPSKTLHTKKKTTRRALAALAVATLSILGAACAPSASTATSDEVYQAIDKAFGPYGVTAKAVRVAQCESGLNPNAGYPDAYYKGLFQLGPHVTAINHYGGNWFDPYQNAAAARDLYVTRGDWSAWPNCGRA
jgi:hypothetical protein